MTDYTELVKALRICNRIDHVGNCSECFYGGPNAPAPKQYVNGCKRSMCEDAAAAIEALQAQLPKRGEIVRCRECRWGYLCVTGQHLGLDGFCSKGEREVQE